jgi:hypothetical protein
VVQQEFLEYRIKRLRHRTRTVLLRSGRTAFRLLRVTHVLILERNEKIITCSRMAWFCRTINNNNNNNNGIMREPKWRRKGKRVSLETDPTVPCVTHWYEYVTMNVGHNQTWVKYFLKVFRINTRILTRNSIPNMYSNTL